MPLLPTPTPLQLAAQAGAEAVNYTLSVIRSQWHAVWDRDPSVVLAELNADIETNLILLGLYDETAGYNNGIMQKVVDMLPDEMKDRYSTRAPRGMPAYWSFTNGVFSYNPPAPEPEEEPLP